MKVKKFIKLQKNYGIFFMIISLLDSLFIRLPNNDIYHYLHKIKYMYVKKYIYKRYSRIIDNEKRKLLHRKNVEQSIGSTKYVWIFWWQGMVNSPDLVKRCVDNTKRQFNDRKVILVTEDNYKNYISIPEEIIKKVNDKVFSLTFFSDYIRFSLLSKYGGIWCDSTVLISKNFKIPSKLYFYTVKHDLYKKWHISGGKWSGFFLASGRHNNGVIFIKKILEEYMLKENTLIAYLLIDVFMQIAYEQIPKFRSEVNSVPINNKNVFKLNELLDKKYTDNFVLPANINKLSYKQAHKIYVNGDETIYGKLLNTCYSEECL